MTTLQHVGPNPVFHSKDYPHLDLKPGWYFWDEVWADHYGPYPTVQEAIEKCKEYADSL